MRLIQLSDLIDIYYLLLLTPRLGAPPPSRSKTSRSSVDSRARLSRVSGTERHRRSLTSEEGQNEREKDTQNDGGRQWEIEREVVAADHEVARKATERYTPHHQEP